MLTVCCVFVKGPYPYTADYVVRLERMVRRYLARPIQFVCLVDQHTIRPVLDSDTPIRVVQVDSVAPYVPTNGGGYWNKVRLFDPKLFTQGRVLYLDLDSLIVAPLDPIVDYPTPFGLTEDAFVVERAHLDTDRYGRKLVRRYNSSVMVWDAGHAADIWTSWTPAIAARLSTDQDWIGERHPEAAAIPLDWFPRISKVQPPWPADAKVVLVKKPKNHEAVTRWPWFEPLWGGWA